MNNYQKLECYRLSLSNAIESLNQAKALLDEAHIGQGFRVDVAIDNNQKKLEEAISLVSEMQNEKHLECFWNGWF